MKNLIAIICIYAFPLLTNSQKNGDVREAGPDRIIESYYETTKEWLPVCQESINQLEQDAICKSLGRKSAKYKSSYQSCSRSSVYQQKKLSSIKGYFGIDMSSNSKNNYYSRSCNIRENFKECLDRYVDYQWKESNCGDNDCFKLTCELDKTVQEDQSVYGKASGSNKNGDVKLTSKNQLYSFTGDFWDPVCPQSFYSSDATSSCKFLGYDDYSSYKTVSCDFPKKDGFRDKNFQNIFCLFSYDNIHDCTTTSSYSCKDNYEKCVQLECEKTNWTGLIVGIVVGVVVVGLVILGCIYYKRQQRIKQMQIVQQQQQNMTTVNAQQPLPGQYMIQNPNQPNFIMQQQIPQNQYQMQQPAYNYNPGMQQQQQQQNQISTHEIVLQNNVPNQNVYQGEPVKATQYPNI